MDSCTAHNIHRRPRARDREIPNSRSTTTDYKTAPLTLSAALSVASERRPRRFRSTRRYTCTLVYGSVRKSFKLSYHTTQYISIVFRSDLIAPKYNPSSTQGLPPGFLNARWNSRGFWIATGGPNAEPMSDVRHHKCMPVKSSPPTAASAASPSRRGHRGRCVLRPVTLAGCAANVVPRVTPRLGARRARSIS